MPAGDLIEIPIGHEMMMGCDAVLLNGNCIVNESMLTGESVPVIKTPLPRSHAIQEFFNIEEQKRSVLFNGTQVLQTRSYDKSKVLAVVVRTGWYFGPEKKGRGPLQVNEYIKSIIRILRKYCPNIKVVN